MKLNNNEGRGAQATEQLPSGLSSAPETYLEGHSPLDTSFLCY